MQLANRHGRLAVGLFDDDDWHTLRHVRRAFRLVRLAKLLRLARLKRMIRKYQDTLNLEAYIGLVFTMGTIVLTAHMMACFWYLIGTTASTATLRHEQDNGTVWFETGVRVHKKPLRSQHAQPATICV